MWWLSKTSILLAITASLLGACQIPGENWGWEDAWVDDLAKTSAANEPDDANSETEGDTSSATKEITEQDTPSVTAHVSEENTTSVTPVITKAETPKTEEDTSTVTPVVTIEEIPKAKEDTSSVTPVATIEEVQKAKEGTSSVTPVVTKQEIPKAEEDTSSVSTVDSKEVALSVTAEPTQYPPYHGPKKTLAVLEFENKAKGSFGSQEIGEGMAEMLTTELFNSNRFILVERDALKEILKEQELGQTGLIRTETAARVGGLAGAQLLIKGVVSEFEYKQAGRGFGFGIEQIRLGMKSSNAHVGIDVRVIDATTGQIIASECASAKAKSSGFSVDYYDDDTPLQVGTSAFNKTPLGVATREAIHKAVHFIIAESEKHVWSGAVIKASGSIAYINRGANSNIHPGERLTIYSCGEELIDPQTGISLGSIEQRVGTLIITDVKDKFSFGRLQMEVSGVPVKRGDIVRLE